MSAPSMPPHFPFVDGGYIQVLTLLGHTDFRICCHPFRHHPEEPGGCDMCRRILTDTGTVEFRPSAPVDLYSFKADPTATHHFSHDREPHLATNCTDACLRSWEYVALPGTLAPRLPYLSGSHARRARVRHLMRNPQRMPPAGEMSLRTYFSASKSDAEATWTPPGPR